MRITLPAIRGSVMVGAVLAFAISFDELVIALFLSGTNSVTLPVRMWQGIQFEQTPVIAAAATVLLGGVFAIFALLQISHASLAGPRRARPSRAGRDLGKGVTR
jgi:ABC-type spermidine/putrescine transport system permease subunit II